MSIVYWKRVFQSQGRRKVLEGRRKDLERGLQQGTSGRFTTRTEDLCTVQQKAIVQCPLVCSWGRKKLRSVWSMQRVAPALEETAAQALFSLTVVLNRNTLVPSTNLVDGKGTLDRKLRTATATRSLIRLRAREDLKRAHA